MRSEEHTSIQSQRYETYNNVVQKSKQRFAKLHHEEFPNGVDDKALINFAKAGGGSIRALEIEMEDTLYLVRMEDEEYYQKYLAKDDDDEDSDEDLDDVDMDDLESSDADDED